RILVLDLISLLRSELVEVSAVAEARKQEQALNALQPDAGRGIVADLREDRGAGRRDLIHRERVLEPDLVHPFSPLHPRVPDDNRAPGNRLVESVGRAGRAAATEAGPLLVLLRIADEYRLSGVELAVGAERVQVRMARLRERPLDCRIELRLARIHS